MHVPSLIKTHWYLHKLSFGNENIDGRTDGHTDNQRETIIPRHYRVAGHKKKTHTKKKKNKKNSDRQVFKNAMIFFFFLLFIGLLFSLKCTWINLLKQKSFGPQRPARGYEKKDIHFIIYDLSKEFNRASH